MFDVKLNSIPFVEYLVGRRSGQYQPGPKPVFDSCVNRLNRMIKEAETLDIKRVAEQSLPPPHDQGYADQAKIVGLLLAKRGLSDVRNSIWNEISAALESRENPSNLDK